MRNPAHVLAMAPVARLAVLLSLGNVLECPSPAAAMPPDARRLASSARRRSALRPEKYIAEPHPVRRVLGSVPLQNWRMGWGPLAMSLMVPKMVFWCDCCTRVLRRSAG